MKPTRASWRSCRPPGNGPRVTTSQRVVDGSVIDLAVDDVMLGFTGLRDPTHRGLSKTRRSKLLSEMLLESQRYIRNEFRTGLKDRCADILVGDTGWNLT